MSDYKIAILRNGEVDGLQDGESYDADGKAIKNVLAGDFSSDDVAELEKLATVGGAKGNDFKNTLKHVLGFTYPKAGVFGGTVHSVSDESTLTTAMGSAVDGDVISLTADITLTSTLVINKRLKFTGGFALQSAGGGADPVNLISVTADGVYFDSSLSIKHRTTTTTSVELAVNVNALDFVSEASVEFVETGYELKGSFSIHGATIYNAEPTKGNRHFYVRNVVAPSQIDGVTFDFNYATDTYVSNFILHRADGSNKFNSALKVSNCIQSDPTKALRQFYLLDVLNSDEKPSLIFENNEFDENYGSIGIVGGSGVSVLNLFNLIALFGNVHGNTSFDNGRSKGLFFIDGGGSLHDIGSCPFYYADNTHSFCNKSDYDSAYDEGGIAYSNKAYNAVTITPESSINYDHSSVISHLATKKEVEDLKSALEALELRVAALE